MLLSDRKESPIRGITGLGGGIASYIFYGSGTSGEYELSRSLSFDPSDTTYLQRTYALGGNRQIWTASFWMKPTPDNVGVILAAYNGTSIAEENYATISISAAFQLRVGNASIPYKLTTRRYKDLAAWYHIVIAVDTTNPIANNRVRIYTNGVEETQFEETNNPPLNQILAWNGPAFDHRIGSEYGQQYYDGYLADFHFIDGQALNATEFGEFDESGFWQPKEFTGSYNTAGTGTPYSSTSTMPTPATVFDGDANTFASQAMTSTDWNIITGFPITFSPGVGTFTYTTSNCGAIGGSNWRDLRLTKQSDGTQTTIRVFDCNGWSIPSAWRGIELRKIEWRRWNSTEAVSAVYVDGVMLTDSGYAAGVNGFHLDFSDISSNTALGTDSSGENNNWSVNNLEAGNPGQTVASATGALPILNTSGDYGDTITSGVRLDSDFSDIVLALPLNGTDGSTTITDYHATIKGSGSAKAITVFNGNPPSGGADISTLVSQFYGSSFKTLRGGVNANQSDYITRTGDTDLAFGQGQFTVEFWFYPTQLISNYVMFDNRHPTTGWPNSANGFAIQGNSSGTIHVRTDGSNQISADYVIENKSHQWHHIVVQRESGSNTQLYVNGVYQNAFSDSRDYNEGRFTLGSSSPNGEGSEGYFSDLRIYKGTAKYSGNFTVPARPNLSPSDVVIDTPTNYTSTSGNPGGNYATLNSLYQDGTYSNGNLDLLTQSGNRHYRATIGVSSGKWYWEVQARGGATDPMVAVVKEYAATDTNANSYGGYAYYGVTGNKQTLNLDEAYGESFTTDDIIGVALDVDAGTLTFYKNGVSQGQAFEGLTSDLGPYFPAFSAGSSTNTTNIRFNAGQKQFVYDPPSDHKALCATNLPTATIPDSSAQFDVISYTGTESTQTVSGLGFAPGFVWNKGRLDIGGNITESPRNLLWDITRGAGKRLVSDDTGIEDTGSATLTSFTSDGFTLGSSTDGNDLDQNYVSWNWNAGDGSRTYTVKVVNDSGNKYQFDDSGQSAVTLDLEEGATYVFDASDSSVDGHPFVLGTSANSNEYSTGVTYTLDGSVVTYSAYTSGFASATTRTLTITVPASAPTLYYWCSIHSGMGGQINTNETAGSTTILGSLNTTAFDQSQNWSANYIGNNGVPPTQAFDGTGPSKDGYAHQSEKLTLTFSPALSGRIIVYGGTGGSTVDTFTLSDGSVLGSGTQYNVAPYYDELDFGVKSNITSLECSSGYALYGIRVDGKLLVDSTVSLGNFPNVNSVVRANPTAGFSMVKWENPSGLVSLPHGLGDDPALIITKNRDGNDQWQTYHKDLGNNKKLYLSSTDTQVDTSVWNSYTPNEHYFYFDDNRTGSWIAYCWTPIKNYSAFGEYTGDSTNFQYTGFAPKFVMIKGYSSTAGFNWVIVDSFRGYDDEQVSKKLYPNLSTFENNDGRGNETKVVLLSNGFTFVDSGAETNSSTRQYIWAAFADHPFSSSSRAL